MQLILLGRLGQFILAFVGIRLATTLLTPSEMGRMALVIAITSAFALTLVNPVGMFINRRLHAWQVLGRASGYLALYWLYLAGVALASGILIYLGATLGAIEVDIALGWLVVLVCGSLIFNTINQTYLPSLNLLGHRGWFVGLTLATHALGIVWAVILVTQLSANAENWLLGLMVGQLLVGIAGMKVFEYKIGGDHEKLHPADALGRKYRAALFRFAWPVSIAVGFGWLQSQSYRFFMNDAAGLAQLGLFVAGYSISAGIIAAFESVLTMYFQPQFYKGVNTSNSVERAAAWNSYASAIIPALIVTVLFVAVLTRELSQIFLGPAFQVAAEFVLWGALAEATRVVAGIYTLSAHAQMQTQPLLLPHALGAMLSLSLAWFLIPLLGGVGAGITLTASGLLLVAILAWQAHRQLAINFPMRRAIFGMLAGAVIMILAGIMQYVFRQMDGMSAMILILGLSGVVYAGVQYYLMSPLLEGAGKQA